MGARAVHLLHCSDGVRRARLCHLHKTVHFKCTHFTIPNGPESNQIATNKNPVCTSPRSLSSAEVTSRWGGLSPSTLNGTQTRSASQAGRYIHEQEINLCGFKQVRLRLFITAAAP